MEGRRRSGISRRERVVEIPVEGISVERGRGVERGRPGGVRRRESAAYRM